VSAEAESGVFILKLLQSMSLLLGICAVIIGFISFARRRPPLSEEVYRDFVRTGALAALRDELRQGDAESRRQVEALRKDYMTSVDELFTLNRKLSEMTGESLRAIARTLGRHDGKLENCPGPKACASRGGQSDGGA
jgi:hypothetical protein